MLTKEELSKIAGQAIGTLFYTYTIAKTKSQNGYVVRLYDSIDEELVARLFVVEGDKPGCFAVDSALERSNNDDCKVLRDINSQLSEYFDEQLEPKYYIKLLNTDYGYLAKVEGTDTWSITSLKIAKTSNQKVAFTAGEISEIAHSDLCANLDPMDLWRAAEEVED